MCKFLHVTVNAKVIATLTILSCLYHTLYVHTQRAKEWLYTYYRMVDMHTIDKLRFRLFH